MSAGALISCKDHPLLRLALLDRPSEGVCALAPDTNRPYVTVKIQHSLHCRALTQQAPVRAALYSGLSQVGMERGSNSLLGTVPGTCVQSAV